MLTRFCQWIYVYFIALYFQITKTLKRNSDTKFVLNLKWWTNFWNNKSKPSVSTVNVKVSNARLCQQHILGWQKLYKHEIPPSRKANWNSKYNKRERLLKCIHAIVTAITLLPTRTGCCECFDGLVENGFPYLQNFRGNHTVAVLWM